MLHRKASKNYQNLSEEQKKTRYYADNRYRKLFIENEFREEEKTKSANKYSIYLIIFLKKK